MSTKTGRIFQFGKFQVDALARTLRREDAIVKLNSRAFDVLLYLVQNPGRVLTRDELLKNVWQDAFVDESSLPQTVSLLRRALEEKPGDHSYIVTVPGRGYQFASAVQVVASEDGNTPPEAATAAQSNSSGLIFQKHTVETSVVTTKEKRELSSPISRSRTLVRAVGALLIAVLVVVLVVRFRGPRHSEQRRELVERQLTANPPENSIGPATISRDGKYLAYSDSVFSGLYLLAIDSGEVREVPLPGHAQPWDWFPDGNHLLTSGAGFDLWKVSTLDSSQRQLWGGRVGDVAVSPDGSHVAFVKWPHELWLMGADGEEPHPILASDADVLSGLAWAPGGQRLAYIRRRGALAKHEVSIETCDLAGGARSVVLADPHLWGPIGNYGIAWLPDGRVVYSIHSGESESNLWTLSADPSTGKPSGGPTPLVGWKNFRAIYPQASGDGKRLIAARLHTETGIYIGNLPFGKKAFTPHRFTPDDWWNRVTEWTKDGKAILFDSKRNGKWAIYRQDLGAKTSEILIAGPENYSQPRLSAEGMLLYSATVSTDLWDPRDTTIRLMSTPEQGGARTTLLKGRYEYACGSLPSSSCVVAELKDGHLIFSHLDPLKGRGEEIARVDEYLPDIGLQEAHWDLSPDGTRIAIVDEGERKGEIRILNLVDRSITVLPVRDWRWSTLALISWAADGKSWFALAGADGSSDALLSIDANGDRRVLYQTDDQLFSIVPSPDGERLAFTKRVAVGDVMLLENF
jgi:DNA-binding winged helix-turn-helix (wHTH) protein/Tol biopolymer transport system component